MKPGNFEPEDVAYLSSKGITITRSRTFPDGGILHFGSVRPSVELITPARRAAAELPVQGMDNRATHHPPMAEIAANRNAASPANASPAKRVETWSS